MSPVTPGVLADAPALIERILPVQKLSVESYREQMAGCSKTLTALGSYWKGRKPLILAKACVLGCLLPATDDPDKDLLIFELLMALDDEALAARAKRRLTPKDVLMRLAITLSVRDYFTITPDVLFLDETPRGDWGPLLLEGTHVAWRDDVPEQTRRRLEAMVTPGSFSERVQNAFRAEEMDQEALYAPIWERVNAHLGTEARSFPELIEQLGIMRWGCRPRLADPFCGSGQISYEAARLGCDVYASDLNPIACLLTWGAFHIAGGSAVERRRLERDQTRMIAHVREEIDRLGVETNSTGARAKVFLYCLESRCPQSGWMVPMLTSRVISRAYRTIAELIPDDKHKRYEIVIRSGVSDAELIQAARGTVQKKGRGGDPYLVHTVDGREYRTPVGAIRGDYRRPDGSTGNRLRAWELQDFMPRPEDVFQERLYCIQWLMPGDGARDRSIFLTVTGEDLERERAVQEYVRARLAEWQQQGLAPDMRIESGETTDQLLRTRGWTYWHHLFNPRQLLIGALARSVMTAHSAFTLLQALNDSSRLSAWQSSGHSVQPMFANQTLSTLYNYACRSSEDLGISLLPEQRYTPISGSCSIHLRDAARHEDICQLFITDPPYGNAIRYEEIYDVFIAWLRRDPPEAFRYWIWDSRRALSVCGAGDAFRRQMAAVFNRIAWHMPDNGRQVVMFTHQSSAIWADMATILWAAGLQVIAAWYVVTEHDSGFRQGCYVKGTVLLVLRKRTGDLRCSRADLGWEIQDAVRAQLSQLVDMNRRHRRRNHDEEMFTDADLQMAGYAAGLRVLTQYRIIDGRDMTEEALRPRRPGEISLADEMIAFAASTANAELQPEDIDGAIWRTLSGVERFYLKLLEMEVRSVQPLDAYQNFAKAFHVRDYRSLLVQEHSQRPRLKSAMELGRSAIGGGTDLAQTPLRAILYALMELQRDTPSEDVVAHLAESIPGFRQDGGVRHHGVQLCEAIERRTRVLRPAEASSARILAELIGTYCVER